MCIVVVVVFGVVVFIGVDVVVVVVAADDVAVSTSLLVVVVVSVSFLPGGNIACRSKYRTDRHFEHQDYCEIPASTFEHDWANEMPTDLIFVNFFVPVRKVSQDKKYHQNKYETYTCRQKHFNPLGQRSDTPQFRGRNPYFFSENLYQSVSFIYASTYRENVHAIHITMQFAKKTTTLCNKNRQPAAKNQHRSFTSRGKTVGLAGLRL